MLKEQISTTFVTVTSIYHTISALLPHLFHTVFLNKLFLCKNSKICRCMKSIHLISMSVQPSSITLFRVPFPCPTPQGRRASQLRTTLMHQIVMRHKARSRSWTLTNQCRQGARVAARPESKASAPHVFNLLERLSPPSNGFS